MAAVAVDVAILLTVVGFGAALDCNSDRMYTHTHVYMHIKKVYLYS